MTTTSRKRSNWLQLGYKVTDVHPANERKGHRRRLRPKPLLAYQGRPGIIGPKCHELQHAQGLSQLQGQNIACRGDKVSRFFQRTDLLF